MTIASIAIDLQSLSKRPSFLRHPKPGIFIQLNIKFFCLALHRNSLKHINIKKQYNRYQNGLNFGEPFVIYTKFMIPLYSLRKQFSNSRYLLHNWIKSLEICPYITSIFCMLLNIYSFLFQHYLLWLQSLMENFMQTRVLIKCKLIFCTNLNYQ